MSTYQGPIALRGDMIGSLTGSPWNQGNPGDANFGMVLPGVKALGCSGDEYRLSWTGNVNTTDDHFRNGQFWTLQHYDPAADPDRNPSTGNDGWNTVPGYGNMTPKNDLVAGMGAGDEHIVFDTGHGFLVYNINGGLPMTPTTQIYSSTAEVGNPLRGDNDGELDFCDAYGAYVPLCFTPGTQIDTPQGPRPVEDLAPGDLVTTRDRGAQPLIWVGRRVLDGAALARNPRLVPVRIAAHALGPGLPGCDLCVSPQHRILLRSRIAERMFGLDEVLVPAICLLSLPGVTRDSQAAGVTYLHLMCERHEILTANGAPAESLLPGPRALAGLPPAARAEILALFPEALFPETLPPEALAAQRPPTQATGDVLGADRLPLRRLMAPARPIARGAWGRRLARRLARRLDQHRARAPTSPAANTAASPATNPAAPRPETGPPQP